MYSVNGPHVFPHLFVKKFVKIPSQFDTIFFFFNKCKFEILAFIKLKFMFKNIQGMLNIESAVAIYAS